jgi:hypothetical protein
MQRISAAGGMPNPYASQYGYGSGFSDGAASNISIELGTDDNISNLETLWNKLSSKYEADLSRYEPFFSVDAPADGQGKELFHLRIGPVKTLEEGGYISRTLSLVKVSASTRTRPEIMKLAELMGARIVDVSKTSLTLEFTDTIERTEVFMSLLRPYGIKETVRTGAIAVETGHTVI